MAFTHLHLHTSYSLLDGSGRIKEMVARVKELGQKAMAITDHGVMYGCTEFYNECKQQGIKPILGCEVYVSPGSRFDREAQRGEDKYNHLVLLAKNDEGYHNLIKIVSIGFLDGFYYKPRVDYEILEKYHEGIIALSACLAGEIPKYIAQDRYDDAVRTAKKLNNIFGEGNFYLELQNHGYALQNKVNIALVKMSKELGIDLVATNDVHYTLETDVEAHDALLCIQTGKKVSDTDRLHYDGGQFFIKSEEQMRELFPYAEEAIDNTQKIVDKCDVKISFTSETHKYHLPIFKTPNGETSTEYLIKISNEGLRKRYNRIDETLRNRLDYELKTISDMGFVDYFLIVQDYINFAKNNDIPVGPGRGSAAGSLVAYTLGITDIDPIRYKLLFERFLNPERVSMPDIDVDFCEQRRGEVIDYVSNKYGATNVSQIITFGTLKAKAVFKDVARVLDIPYVKSNEISKLIPTKVGDTLNVTYDDVLNADIKDFDSKGQMQVLEFRKLYNEDPDVKKVVDLSLRLEGIPRHASMHASGILIAPSNIYDYVPLVVLTDNSGKSSAVAGENMTTLEKLGLLKMDFLGLRNLSAIKETLDSVNKKYNKKIDFTKLDYNDKNIFDMISKGQTTGVFQLESAGMTNFMKDLKPENLEDIIAGISLYRPGPMDFIPKYIEGKKNRKNIKYDCPELKPILEPTYGCIVYQEQVMQIFRELAGYSYGGADLVRRAMSKKHADELQRERSAFMYGDSDRNIKGCVKNGIKDSIAAKIFEDVLGFAKYAFNKSHAAAYAHIAYQTAYLKYYYPVEFICALCNSVINDRDSLFEYINHAKSIGLKITPPNVNKSGAYFTSDGNNIMMGFAGLKGVANNLSDIIIFEREKNGEYKSFYDFIKRLTDKGINKTAIEALIYSGALDQFEGNRKQKLLIYPEILKDDTQNGKQVEGQVSLIELMNNLCEEKNDTTDKQLIEKYKNIEELSKDEICQKEREITGLYLSAHPLEDYEKVIKNYCNCNTSYFEYDEEKETTKAENFRDKNMTIAALCMNVNEKLTKKGDKMAILTIEDEYGEIEAIVFPKVYNEYAHLLKKNEKLLLTGHPDVSAEGNAKLLVDKIESLDSRKKILTILFNDAEDYKLKIQDLLKLCDANKGKIRVKVKLINEKLQKELNNAFVSISDDFLSMLKEKGYTYKIEEV